MSCYLGGAPRCAGCAAGCACLLGEEATLARMGDDKVIQFPGNAGRPGDARKPKAAAPAKPAADPPASGAPAAPLEPQNLSEDQKKALQIVLSGMPFIAIGIKPTGSGADFFTAVHGEGADLRNAAGHLPGVIERAFERKGV